MKERNYYMHPGDRSIWVLVDNIAVNIVKHEDGVSVDLYPKGYEWAPLDRASTTFEECQSIIDVVKEKQS